MINNRKNSITSSRDPGYLHCDVITALKFPSSHDTGKKFGEELQVQCCVVMPSFLSGYSARSIILFNPPKKDENLAKDGKLMG